jgi:hypothetical protein
MAGMAVGVALLAAGCGGTANIAPPVGATPVPVTETFTDTIERNGAKTYPFVAQAGGTVTASLTAVSPAVMLGVSLGTWNGLACQVVIANDKAVLGTVVTGTASAIGNLCARVYDVGSVTEATQYTLSVFHP